MLDNPNVLHFGHEEEGIGGYWNAQDNDYSLLECTAPLQGQALLAVNAGQSNALHFGHEEEGIGRSWNAQENDYSLLECTAPLQGQALLVVNSGQSNVQHSGCFGRGIGSAVVDEEAQISPAVSTGPLERPTRPQDVLRTHWWDELDSLLYTDQVQEGWLTHPSCKHCWRI